jgi:hypothetical protein
MATTAKWGFDVAWRSVIVGAGYIAASMLAGMVFGFMGLLEPVSDGAMVSLGWLLAASVLLGLFLGILAAHIRASFGQHLLIWTSVIFFNLGAVALEGAFFVPELVPIPIPLLAVQQFVAAGAAGLLITLLFAPRGQAADMANILSRRPWFAWLWRIVLASAGYLLYYLVFGALNYALVTGPYYASHAGGLTVPDAATVLRVELVRAPLLVLSIVPFVLAYRAPRRRSMWMTGLLLFWVGGVVPLVLQMGMLPVPLLLASGVEIFLQNFLTGVVAAALLWMPEETGVAVGVGVHCFPSSARPMAG